MYQIPEINVLKLDVEDVITTSASDKVENELEED